MIDSERMQRAQWDCFWCPRDAQVTARSDIQYITCRRPFEHLNSVMRTSAADHELPALVAEVSKAHAHSDSRWLTYGPQDHEPLVRALEAGGYQRKGRSTGVITHIDDYRSRGVDGIRVHRIQDIERLRMYDQIADSAFGIQHTHHDNEYHDHLRHCAGPNARIFRALAYDRADRPIACGSMNLYPALDLAYLWGGATAEDARGRGAYSAVLAARVAYARQSGISYLGVYADPETSLPILLRRGFRSCDRMTWWSQPPAQSDIPNIP